jgi:ribonuclease P protein component
MRRPSDFSATLKLGRRAAQPDLVVHARRANDDDEKAVGAAPEAPRVGLIIARSVGTAVQRHRVARRLRHVCRTLLGELSPAEQLVIRALPSSKHVGSARLEQQLRAGLRGVHGIQGAHR